METVAAVQELQDEIRRRMPDVTFTVDAPATPSASWWVDVQRRRGLIASVEWRPGHGFGVASPGGGFGEGVDHVEREAAAAAGYIQRVSQHTNDLETKSLTSPLPTR
jgi:hypothetical protein